LFAHLFVVIVILVVIAVVVALVCFQYFSASALSRETLHNLIGFEMNTV